MENCTKQSQRSVSHHIQADKASNVRYMPLQKEAVNNIETKKRSRVGLELIVIPTSDINEKCGIR